VISISEKATAVFFRVEIQIKAEYGGTCTRTAYDFYPQKWKTKPYKYLR